jgi:cytochrome c oxidase subunit 4
MVNAHETPSPAPAHAAGEHGPHVLPPRVLLGTAAALLALTAVTVAVARVDLGAVNVAVALGVATVKATLVALFFMHLKYEHRFHLVVLVGATLFAVLFASFVLFDTAQVRPDVRAHEAAQRQRAP